MKDKLLIHAVTLKDVANLELLIETLEKRGFHRDEIEKIAYKNWLRVTKSIL